MGDSVKVGLCEGQLRWAYVGDSVKVGLWEGQC